MRESLYATFGMIWLVSFGAALAALLAYWLGDGVLLAAGAVFLGWTLLGIGWGLFEGFTAYYARRRN